MDVVRESGQAYVKRKLHLPIQLTHRIPNHKHGLNISQVWILLPLFLFTCADAHGNGEVTVETCIGENASFDWDYEVQPFHTVEWYFEKTHMAVTLEEHLSQVSLIFNNNTYTSRFLLLEDGKVGFSLINVTWSDEGDYKCILTLKRTSIPVELKKTLNVTDCNTHSTSTIRSGEGTPKPTPAEDANTLAIVLGVLISCVVAIGLLGVFGLWRWRRKGDTIEVRERFL
ncbi:uncharacterized protein LOC124258162 [Haliotis rubra]|uniref:uncharacterized protein LOC124258162 n=1 Tax=Haliotis rubra TaxID=36100 RepID=UPI001EE53BB5|nr:uncharacterized protein LOC124258162 [Haliotis rubra]